MGRRVWVTGGTGTVGAAVCRRFVQEGWRLVLTGRQDEARFRAGTNLPCEYRQWSDPAATPPPPEALQVDAAVHLLGEPVADRRWNSEVKGRIRDSRVLSSRQIVNGIRMLPEGGRPEVLVSASAVGYYGNRGQESLDESAPSGSDFLAGVCRDWEREVSLSPFRSVSLRIGVVLSEEGGALSKMRPIFRRGLGGRLGSGTQWMSWIHVADLSEAILFAVRDTALSGPVNAVSPGAVTNEDFTKAYCQALGVRVGPPAPELFLRLAFGERAGVLLGSQRVQPRALVERGFKFRYPELGAALDSVVGSDHSPKASVQVERKGSV